MYAAIILLMLCKPPELGSYWASIPGVLIGFMFVIHTILEDRMLRQELPGYIEYADQVHHRLVPEIW